MPTLPGDKDPLTQPGGWSGVLSVRKTAIQPQEGASLMDSVFAAGEEALLASPVSSIARMDELRSAKQSGRQIGADDARAQIESRGLKGHLTIPDQGVTQDYLDILINRKEEELRRGELIASAPQGFGAGSARFGASFVASMFDPINVASAFVPVVGQARYLKWLGQANGIAGRTAVRAGVGATEGLAGAALVEPLIAMAKDEEQADYDMADSLANIAFGTVFGGGLHVVGGAGGDLYRRVTGATNPWDLPELKAGRESHAAVYDDIQSQLIAAGRGADEAAANASLVASAFRSLSDVTGRGVDDLYAEFGPRISFARDVDDIGQPSGLRVANQLTDAIVEGRRYGQAEQAAALPVLETYADAQAFIAQRGKEMGGVKRYASTEEYRRLYPRVDELYKAQKAKTAAERVAQLSDAGLKIGDEVTTTYGGMLAGFQEARGKIVDYGGVPHVEIDGSPITVSRGGRLSETGRVRWTPQWRKPQLRQDKRGSIDLAKGRRINITLFQKADRSTFVHETGHLFLEVLDSLGSKPDAPEALKADLAKARDWMGLKDGEAIGEKHHEQFARGFEAYLREGRAPTPKLKKVFERFRDWLVGIYKDIRALDVTLSDDVKGVYDRLIAGYDAAKKAELAGPAKREAALKAAIAQTVRGKRVNGAEPIINGDADAAKRAAQNEVDALAEPPPEPLKIEDDDTSIEAANESLNEVSARIKASGDEKVILQLDELDEITDQAKTWAKVVKGLAPCVGGTDG